MELSKKEQKRVDCVLREIAENWDFAVNTYRFMRGEKNIFPYCEHFCEITGLPDDPEERDRAASMGAIISTLAIARNSEEVKENNVALFYVQHAFQMCMTALDMQKSGIPIRLDFDSADEHGWPAIACDGEWVERVKKTIWDVSTNVT